MITSDRVQLEFRALFSEFSEAPAQDISVDTQILFWREIIKKKQFIAQPRDNEEEPAQFSVKKLESKLQIILPQLIRSELKAYFSNDSSLREPRQLKFESSQSRVDSLLPLIGIRIAEIRYGSLDLTIEFAGAKYLIELFDANFDVFMMFAQSYLPNAFHQTLKEMSLEAEDFYFEVTPTNGLIAAFAGYTYSPQPAPNIGTQEPPHEERSSSTNVTSSPAFKTADRVNAIWKLTNFTLLVPVALSLIVLYTAAKALSDEKSDLKDRSMTLSAREQAFANSIQDRITQLEKTQGDLITLLRAPPKNTKK